jgi:2-hydroxychromene-2-carboxylate isomerase
MAPPIVFYFDFVSPYAYIGSVAIERMAKRLGRDAEWRPILIGITILKIMGMKPLPQYPLKGPYLKRDKERLSEWFNVPIRDHGLKGINSLIASRAFLHLRETDEKQAKLFAQAVFRRLWLEGKDITQLADVLEVAGSLNIDPDRLESELSAERSKQMLRDEVDAGVEAGVFGVPTFLADGELFWGSDHLWMLEHWLQHHSFKQDDSEAASSGR